jgi:signal transduction histidine kinase
MTADPGWTRGRQLLAHRLLIPLFEGGEEGRQRAVLIYLCLIAPVSLVVTTLLAEHSRPWLVAGRVAAIAVAIAWVALRRNATRGEWWLLIALVGLTNAGGQVLVGRGHSGLAILSVVIFVIVCVVFDAATVAFAGIVLAVLYLAVQLHFGGVGDAAGAELLYVLSVGVAGLTVHGTALYLRDALRRTTELHAEMRRTAELERARIAGELHDDTIQVLTATALQLDELGRRLERAGSAEAPAARSARDMLGQALERARRLTFELYPAQLDQRGLEPSLRMLAQQAARDAGFSVELSVAAEGLPGPIAQLAYRTIKELLANAGKHAQASTVRISVTAEHGVLAAEVVDDGRGFEEAELARARRAFHLGIASARDRVEAAGGTFTITSAPGEGTRARFTLPLGQG